MPVSFVNRTSETRTTSATTISQNTITVTAGDYLIACVSTRATGDQTPTHTMSSTVSTTWTTLGFITSPDVTSSGVGLTTTIFGGRVNASGSATMTATFASTNGRAIIIDNFRGVVSTPTVVNGFGTSSTSPVGPGGWTTQGGSVGDAILFYVSGNFNPTSGSVYSTSTVGGTWSTGFATGLTGFGIATQRKILTFAELIQL